MKIGIVGGTGGMGRGFAMRWSASHDIVVGSRDAGRAEAAAKEYAEAASEAHGKGVSISGAANEGMPPCDVLVLSIGYDAIDSTCPAVLRNADSSCVIVSPIVPMAKTDRGFEYVPLVESKPSAYEAVKKHAKDPAMLVSAFHVISEKKLADPGRELDYDIFVCGEGRAAETVRGLVADIPGLRALMLGPGSLSYMAEIATPLLLNAMVRNKMKNPGIKIA